MLRNPTVDALVVLLIVLLIFGPKRLPALGKQLGHGIREFKDSITGDAKDSEESERPQLTQQNAAVSQAAPPVSPSTQAAPVTPPAQAPAPPGGADVSSPGSVREPEPAEAASSERRA
ncbi:MAG: twin-arginine translocase TatA/TatE family subunit [Actinomycetota bacterium]|nr:twin-arginine translocase TatA/TatE family subunit [Actinomycetota bacterium]